ncbi:uncharacterized protein LOC121390161 isoform X2 [Gigantopelta aegis]|uniref:uncharacterized protein LOC121390161 isoform X2 n=1 Tax=Gigantopelta aegis TaxID=1735272 RepID=UPI001B8888F4|nr:uncharacterized protein LOC121390161 isoform X2 [Gigantopelta aegis]
MLSQMNIFRRKDHPSSEAVRRENDIKSNITVEFSRGIKVLQQKQLTAEDPIGSDDDGNNLCNILEAVFLHGLKDSFKHKFTSYMNFASQGQQSDFNLNFWNFVIQFTHGDVVTQLKRLSQITTEIGFCRAWVRMALNDGLMESYIHSMIADVKALKHFYASTAYLRDHEQPEILKSYLTGLSSLQFRLSFNSSMLNAWTCTPLTLCEIIEKNPAVGPTTHASTETTQSVSLGKQATSSAKESSDIISHTTHGMLSPDGKRREGSFYSSVTGNQFGVSGFTSKDVEEIKRLTSARRPYTASDNSSSSCVSCPDTGHVVPHPYSHVVPPAQSHVVHHTDSHLVPRPDSHVVLPNLWEASALEDSILAQIEAENESEAVISNLNSSDDKHKEESVVEGNVLEDKNADISNQPCGEYSHDTFLDEDSIFSTNKLMVNCEVDTLESAKCISLVPPTSPKHKAPPVEPALSPAIANTIEQSTDNVPDLSSIRNDIYNVISAADARRSSVEEGPSVSTNSPRGNSLGSMTGWSSHIYEKTTKLTEQNLANFKATSESRPKAASFGALLKTYAPSNSMSNPSIDDVIQNLPSPTDSTDCSPVRMKHSQGNNSHLTQLCEMAVEKGLDSQNYQCLSCNRPIGLFYGKPRVCSFNGGYYCFECHENAEFYIPAAILHNWDFQKQKVSRESFEFLVEVEDQPLLDVFQVNPRLYEHVPELEEIRKLRIQLCSLKTYLFSCQQSLAEELRKKVWPREYFYDNINVYSMMDFQQVATGQLAKTLHEVMRFASRHVYDCAMCSLKGFICELCNNPKVIYPFEIDSTYRCSRCKAVYHKTCMVESLPCPKCQRWGLISGNSPNMSNPAETEDYAITPS